MVKNENWGTRSWRKFRRERTREKFRRLKFQPVLPSSHNRDLRKLPRGRWREVRSKENRESSTAKRDFHPFYLLFPLLLSFSFLFSSFFLPSTLCETRSNRPFEHTTGLASAIPFPPLERKRRRRRRGRKIVNTAIKRGTETKEGLENCEEGYAKRRERWKLGRQQQVERDFWRYARVPPPSSFFHRSKFPRWKFWETTAEGGEFFLPLRGRRRSGRDGGEGGIRRQGKFKKGGMGYLREFNEIVGKN